jgi:hypothetical protein
MEGLLWASGGGLGLQAATRAMTITKAWATRTVTIPNIDGEQIAPPALKITAAMGDDTTMAPKRPRFERAMPRLVVD